MNALITVSRIVAPIFAMLCAFGLLFFADFYLAPENRFSLVIYGLPIPALLLGALLPRKWLRNISLAMTVVFIEIAAIIALAIAAYRDINLINGSDWSAAMIRLAIISVILLLSHSVLKQRKPN
jgi:hypothetical protein